MAGKNRLQVLTPRSDILLAFSPVLKRELSKFFLVVGVRRTGNPHETGIARPAPDLDQHSFQGVRAYDRAKDIDKRDIAIADAAQENHVAYQVRVRLLPERFLAAAPNGRDDGRDVVGLGVSVEIVVEWVV